MVLTPPRSDAEALSPQSDGVWRQAFGRRLGADEVRGWSTTSGISALARRGRAQVSPLQPPSPPNPVRLELEGVCL